MIVIWVSIGVLYAYADSGYPYPDGGPVLSPVPTPAGTPPSSDPGTVIISDPPTAFPPDALPLPEDPSSVPVPPRGPDGDPIDALRPPPQATVITDPAGRPVPSLTASKVA